MATLKCLRTFSHQNFTRACAVLFIRGDFQVVANRAFRTPQFLQMLIHRNWLDSNVSSRDPLSRYKLRGPFYGRKETSDSK